MKLFRIWIYPVIVLVISLAACGPQNSPMIAPPPGAAQPGMPASVHKLLPCTPPSISIDEVQPFCANLATGEGGVTFVVHASDTHTMYYQTKGNATCNYTADLNGAFADSCTGPQGGQFTKVVCTTCIAPNAGAPQSYSAYTCSNGFVDNNVANTGECDPVDPNQYFSACPLGSHYNNDIQNCVDDATQQLASQCPPGFPYYLPDDHLCLAKAYPEAYNCQYFPLQLGVCINPEAIKVVPFCQNRGANKGGANITYEAGKNPIVDVNGNHLDGCTPAGTNLLTCWGNAGMSFNVQLCTDPSDPATCTTYNEVLGTCNNPVPAPTTCAHC